MKIQKLFGQAYILAAISLLIYIGASFGLNYKSVSAVKLEKLWQQDLVNLKIAQKLPSYWSDIRFVKKIPAIGDELAKKWIRDVSSPIEINPKGEYRLEIFFISQKDNNSEKAIIQHHIIHISSGNSVWEIGRTYDLH